MRGHPQTAETRAKIAAYQKEHHHGGVTTRTPADRLWPRVDTSAGPDGCWPFTGSPRNGYGALGGGGRQGGVVYAHRVAYEDKIGPIPDGFQLDHLCHNRDRSCPGGLTCVHRRCCNPSHLEAVPQSVNLARQALRGVA